MFLGLERSFARLEQRVKVVPALSRRGFPLPTFDINVARDRHGEHFLVRLPEDGAPELSVLDVQPGLRQLLLLARTPGRKDKFLCGFDERHLFTAAVPGEGVRDVVTAMRALKPPAVRAEEDCLCGPAIACAATTPPRCGRASGSSCPPPRWSSPPSACAEAARLGGEMVYVSRRHRQPLTSAQYEHLIWRNPNTRTWNWQTRVRNPELYVRGEVRHPDHATLWLPGWHRVLMNTEGEAPGAPFVAFLD
ncbi:hypothetical protein [Deinococcus apachensis]|uniref:hypothetical protein n=1 Tax=Deinococcus apachensis TaxID=309886 RepID=UPI0012FC6929|nr:hypothetical protein [Deinococcus apachensis]